jgi:hypothetical protein
MRGGRILQRRYQRPRACDLIPQGALITVDGNSGRVIIHQEEAVTA